MFDRARIGWSRRGQGVPYDEAFFEGQEGTATRSAAVIVPLVMAALEPASVVDVGCGRGAWSRAFAQAGCETTSVDAPWTDLEPLRRLGITTVERDLTKPLELDRTFDLAVCLEVAEHLPEEAAEQLVRSLCELAPMVLFSGAFPGQGGTHHVNEQPPSWWANRFAACGRVPFDLVRPAVWDESEVTHWYAQNTLLFVPDDHRLAQSRPQFLDVVHPKSYRVALNRLTSVRDVADVLPRSLVRRTIARMRPETFREPSSGLAGKGADSTSQRGQQRSAP